MGRETLAQPRQLAPQLRAFFQSGLKIAPLLVVELAQQIPNE
jgi:hypothetical protein